MKHQISQGRCTPQGTIACGLTVMATFISQAYAQTVAPPPVAPVAPLTVIEVRGYVGSLESTARDKRDAVGFQDSVYAEDLGKFPDANIAESLNRIPGVQISREISGEGINVQIRGLGTSFTKILLNGAPVSVASTGGTDASNTNREVDLDMLPTDLFRRLTVSKSPAARALEGGAAGVVDMRTARAFDKKGRQVSMSLTGSKGEVGSTFSNRGSLLASQTFGDTFGVLAGVSWMRNKTRTEGFESIGYTNPNLSATQSTSATRNLTGGNGWIIPATVPSNAGNGLVPGTAITQAYLLEKNPGLTIDQIDNALVPRLGRNMANWGTRERVSGVLNFEFRPTKNLQFYLDTLYSDKRNEMERIDTNWVVRSGAMIPLNMTVDRADCTVGCLVTGGTFANTQHFLEYRPFIEDVTLLAINPGMQWTLAPKLKLDAQLNYTISKFHRESPSVILSTALNNGNTVTYANTDGVPQITSSMDLQNPAIYNWNNGAGRVNVQDEFRETTTKGARTNLTWGDKKFDVRAGLAIDDIDRSISPRDASGAWVALACGGDPSVYLYPPNTAPGCNGTQVPGSSAAALYPGFRTGATAGRTETLVYRGSRIPASAVASYLQPAPNGLITLDWPRFAADSGYDQVHANAPAAGSGNTGAAAGYIRERTVGTYLEANGETELLGYKTRYNAGVRYVKTHQYAGNYLIQPDPRNLTLLNGGRFPNITKDVVVENQYSNVLPSGTIAINLSKDLILRGSASRTMTRPSPNTLRPGISFSASAADTGSLGNPKLMPYLSDNIDFGGEFYTGRSGYLAATLFNKRINGFTSTYSVTTPFADLAQYGINYALLNQTQQLAIDARGGPDVATVEMRQTRNAQGTLTVRGVELGWVQPLDKWLPVKGFGFSQNWTFVQQKASGEGSEGFVALNVPKRSSNLTAYYERNGYMLRLSQTFSKGTQSSDVNEQTLVYGAQFKNDYRQVDLSSNVDLEEVFERKGLPTLTFDIVNLNRASQRSYLQFANAPYSNYSPGRSYSLGMRLKF